MSQDQLGLLQIRQFCIKKIPNLFTVREDPKYVLELYAQLIMMNEEKAKMKPRFLKIQRNERPPRKQK